MMWMANYVYDQWQLWSSVCGQWCSWLMLYLWLMLCNVFMNDNQMMFMNDNYVHDKLYEWPMRIWLTTIFTIRSKMFGHSAVDVNRVNNFECFEYCFLQFNITPTLKDLLLILGPKYFSPGLDQFWKLPTILCNWITIVLKRGFGLVRLRPYKNNLLN